MGSIGEIDSAISAHGQWKDRLRAAIEAGATEFPIATIRGDETCEFGAWLYGPTISGAKKNTLDYKSIVDLHAHFHNVAGRVVELAVGGNKVDAQTLLSRDFELASEKLLVAMAAWRERIEAASEAETR